MAKQKRDGLSLKDVLNLDWDYLKGMNIEQFRDVYKVVQRNVNKRINKLLSNQETKDAPSINYLKRMVNNNKLSYNKKMTLNQLRKNFTYATHFLGLKTSTMKGIHQIQKELQSRYSIDLQQMQWKEFWKYYRKGEEMWKGGIHNIDSHTLQSILMDKVSKGHLKTEKRFLNSMKHQIDKLYEDDEYAQEMQDLYDVED